jgi:hypothetical protein
MASYSLKGEKMENSVADTLLIGVDFSNGKDVGVLIVGRKKPNETVDIINYFQGDEALELYQRLITKKGEK